MLITYFDEVKPCEPDQPYYWLGGLMVDDQLIPQIEQEMNTLAVLCFGLDLGLTKQTEFHATDIASGKNNFKKVKNPAKRFEILKRLVKIYDKPEGIYRVIVRLKVSKMYPGTDIEKMALMYLIELVDCFAKGKNTNTLLIGDFEKGKTVNKSVRDLAKYREHGTLFAFGQEINNVIDTVHFAHSHNSRMLQLADTYMWTQQLKFRVGVQSTLRTDLINYIREETNTSWPNTYKHRPSNA